jgi:hypothetical protein
MAAKCIIGRLCLQRCVARLCKTDGWIRKLVAVTTPPPTWERPRSNFQVFAAFLSATAFMQ